MLDIDNLEFEPFSFYFNYMGYEHMNVVFNLGKMNYLIISIPLFYSAYYFSVGVLKPDSLIRRTLKKLFFHSFLIRFLLEGALELLLYSALNLYDRQSRNWGEVFS